MPLLARPGAPRSPASSRSRLPAGLLCRGARVEDATKRYVLSVALRVAARSWRGVSPGSPQHRLVRSRRHSAPDRRGGPAHRTTPGVGRIARRRGRRPHWKTISRSTSTAVPRDLTSIPLHRLGRCRTARTRPVPSSGTFGESDYIVGTILTATRRSIQREKHARVAADLHRAAPIRLPLPS